MKTTRCSNGFSYPPIAKKKLADLGEGGERGEECDSSVALVCLDEWLLESNRAVVDREDEDDRGGNEEDKTALGQGSQHSTDEDRSTEMCRVEFMFGCQVYSLFV